MPANASEIVKPLDVLENASQTYIKNYLKITDAKSFLQRLHDQIHISGAAGNATGRNIHQRPLEEAIRFCNAIYAITIEDYSVDAAHKIYQGDSG